MESKSFVCFMGIHSLQFRQYSNEHREKAQASANDIGNRFRQKDTVGSHVKGIWQQIRQRNNDENFSEQ